MKYERVEVRKLKSQSFQIIHQEPKCIDNVISLYQKPQNNKIEPPQDHLFKNLSIKQYPYFQAIGMLCVRWFDQDKKLKSISYGTAFAISPRLILTCSHNLFSQRRKKLCDQMIFIPGIKKGTIQKRKQFKINNTQNIRFSKPKDSFTMLPTRQQIAMVLLQQDLNLSNYLKIGQVKQNSNKTQLKVIGYPSAQYKSTIKLNKVQVKRRDGEGFLYALENHVLHYTVKTDVGQSGSPVIAENQDGQSYVTAIHTHRGAGRYFNSGIYFDDQNMKTIKKYQKQLESILFKKYQDTKLSKFSMHRLIQIQNESDLQISDSFYFQMQKNAKGQVPFIFDLNKCLDKQVVELKQQTDSCADLEDLKGWLENDSIFYNLQGQNSQMIDVFEKDEEKNEIYSTWANIGTQVRANS